MSTSESTERKVNIVYLLLSVAGFLVLAGMQWGASQASQEQTRAAQQQTEAKFVESQKETNEKLDSIQTEISDFKQTATKHEFQITGLTATIGELRGVLTANNVDDARQWETLRMVESQARGAVSRESFIEWKARFERQNPNVNSPPLTTQ